MLRVFLSCHSQLIHVSSENHIGFLTTALAFCNHVIITVPAPSRPPSFLGAGCAGHSTSLRSKKFVLLFYGLSQLMDIVLI
jgi:hypothetical protein